MNAAKNEKTIFHIKNRDVVGKKVSQLRAKGMLPANIYGLGATSQPVMVETKAFSKLYEEEGDTGLIYLSLEGEKEQIPVLIDEVDYHSVTGEVLHAVFRRVNLSEKITAEVPVELVGENDVPGATVVMVRDMLEVSALPAELPENFEVDIAALKEIGDSIAIKDLVIDKEKVEIVMTGDMDEESPLVILQEVKEEEEPEEVSVDDVELVGEEGEGGEGGEKATEEGAPEAQEEKSEE